MNKDSRRISGTPRHRSRSISWVRVFLAVLLAGLVGGCSRSDEPAVAAPAVTATKRKETQVNIDTCSLLTSAEVASVFGELRGKPRADRGLRNEQECRFTNVSGQWLEFSVYGTDRWELEKGTSSEQRPESIRNLGEEAFSVRLGTEKDVYVRTARFVFQASGSCSLDTLETLSSRAIPRLDRQ